MTTREEMRDAAAEALPAGSTPGWMTVRVGALELALPIERVGEVLPTTEVTPVPLVPAWVAGVVAVRGDVIAVLDLGLRLSGVAALRDGRMVIATLDEPGERVGLLVDAVSGLIDRSGATIAPPSRKKGAVPACFVAATVARAGDDALPVLDLGALHDPALPPA